MTEKERLEAMDVAHLASILISLSNTKNTCNFNTTKYKLLGSDIFNLVGKIENHIIGKSDKLNQEIKE